MADSEDQKVLEERANILRLLRHMYTPGLTYEEKGEYLDVKGGSLRAIVRWLLMEGHGDERARTASLSFIRSCEAYGTTPIQLIAIIQRMLEKAEQARIADPENGPPMEQEVIKRITAFMCMWAENAPRDFSGPGSEQLLNASLELVKGLQKKNVMSANRIKLSLIRSRPNLVAERMRNRSHSSGTTPKKGPVMAVAKEAAKEAAKDLRRQSAGASPIVAKVAGGLLDYSVLQLAEQLTRQASSIYNNIKPTELLGLAWRKNPEKAPNLLKLVERSNKMSRWVATEVCLQQELEKRIGVVKRMISLAEKLAELRNYNSCMSIMGGLNNSSVQRLKKTWSGISKKEATKWTKISNLMDPRKSYANYRSELKHRIGQPCVPFLGVFLQDLTFVEDGNPNMLDSKNINFEKVKLVGDVLMQVQTFQAPYHIKRDRTIARYIRRNIMKTCLPEDSDDIMYKLSLQAEPSSADLVEDISLDDIMAMKLKEADTDAESEADSVTPVQSTGDAAEDEQS